MVASLVGTLAVQVAQSLVLITALQVFLASGGATNLGLASTGGLVDLLVSACLCWVLVKIQVPGQPGGLFRLAPVQRHRPGRARRGRLQGGTALAAGVGL